MRRSLLLSAGLVSIILPFAVSAQTTTTTTVVEKPTSATTTVVEKRTIVSQPPQGVCTTVPGHWRDDNTWASTYTECKYQNRTEGVTWVSDYWSCTASNADGTCTTWELVPGHWEST